MTIKAKVHEEKKLKLEGVIILKISAKEQFIDFRMSD